MRGWRSWCVPLLIGGAAIAVGLLLLRNIARTGEERAVLGTARDPVRDEQDVLDVASVSAPDTARLPATLPEEGSGEAATAWITGNVWQRSGAPVADATCRLRRGIPGSGFLDDEFVDGTPEETTRSASDGTFRVRAGTGFWRLEVEAPGFARIERDHLLAGDEVQVRLDAEVCVLVSVVGPYGEPVAGAEVAVRDADDASRSRARCRVETDAGGRAAATGLAPGTWFVSVEHPDYARAGVPLVVPVGRFLIEKEIRLERGARISGTVRAEAGGVIGGARVRLESPYKGFLVLHEVLTGADGRYTTPPMFSLTETIEVLASASGFAEAAAFVGIGPADLETGSATTDFVLPAIGRTVLGRVVSAGAGVAEVAIRLASIDPVGNSPEDVLTSTQAAPPEPWMWQQYARTNGAGEFEIAGLSGLPQYIVLAVREGYAPCIAWVPPGAPGTTTRLADLELFPWGSLFGRATREDGSPAEGEPLGLARVSRVHVASYAELGAFRPDAWFTVVTRHTREDGAFRFDSLAPGTYLFPAFEGRWEIEPGRATGPIEIVIPSGAAAEDVLVTGTIHDRSGAPITPAFVSAFAVEGAAETQLLAAALADARGAFSVRLATSTSARIVFDDLGGAHEPREILLAPPFPAEPLEIVLDERTSPLLPIEGLVLGPRGEPLEGCKVSLRPPQDSLCACIAFETKTDASGTFRFESVSEGPHRLAVSDARLASRVHYPAHAGDSLVIELDER